MGRIATPGTSFLLVFCFATTAFWPETPRRLFTQVLMGQREGLWVGG